ncbi:putative transposase, Ptta/En/Spm, plant [Arabidopsis thaliana]
MSEIEEDGPQTSDNSSQCSSHRTLSLEEKNEIFLKCTHTDGKGNPYGLGSLVETLTKEKERSVMRALLHQPLWIFKIRCGRRYQNMKLKMQNVMRSISNINLGWRSFSSS